MSRAPPRVFLERRTYRRRRLTDAARLLPVVGLLLFLVPLLWAPDRTDTAATASTTIYVFAVWAGLIAAALLLSRRLPKPGSELNAHEGQERAE